MAFSLLQLKERQLRQIAASEVPSELVDRLEHKALPPEFVAERALRLLARGTNNIWACSYLIVRQRDDRIVGGCGFKTEPLAGKVEIGYGVSPIAKGEGAATEAVRQLVAIAFGAGAKGQGNHCRNQSYKRGIKEGRAEGGLHTRRLARGRRGRACRPVVLGE